MDPERAVTGPEGGASPGSTGTQNLRVALSGGGLRAAVFDLGLLLYLVDAGLNARVEQISSVSGGSITNAFVARRCDFRLVSSQEFDRIAADLLKMIVRRGLIRRPLIVGYIALVIAVTIFTVSVWLTQFPVRLSGWVCLLLAVGVGLLWTFRGRVIDLQLERDLWRDSAQSSSRRLSDVTSTVEHIFCSTDLRTGMPFYFSTATFCFPAATRGYVYSPVLGFSRCVESLARVVRASAAFPGGIPPMRYKSPYNFLLAGDEATTQSRITGYGSLGHYLPRVFMLADGGVWDNLATQPFLEDHLWFGPTDGSTTWPVKRSPPLGSPPRLLVVSDASAPVRASGIRSLYVPLLGDVFSFRRSLKVVAENTVRPRIATIRARPDAAVVSILDTKDRALAELRDYDLVSRLPPECDALKWWQAHGKASGEDHGFTFDFPPWIVYETLQYDDKVNNNGDVKTSLGRIPRWRAIMLLGQAYENAQSELSVMLGLPMPKSWTTGGRFEALIPEAPGDSALYWPEDRVGRARQRRRRRTQEPGTVPDKFERDRENWKLRMYLWYLWLRSLRCPNASAWQPEQRVDIANAESITATSARTNRVMHSRQTLH